MAEIRCPNCGKKNPDLLDICQFCQTPLKQDSVLRAGQSPTKKDTGELEEVLPSWLKDVRKQARDSAEEAEEVKPQPQAPKDEMPDFLAGLASQSDDSGGDEIPDWLASISPAAASTPQASSTSAKPPAPASSSPEADFFAQFAQGETAPADEPVQEDPPPSVGVETGHSPLAPEDDELSRWFTQASGQPEEIVEAEPDTVSPAEAPWTSSFDSPPPSQSEPAPREEEDLSWLHNLEATARETEDQRAPKQDGGWTPDFETSAAPSGASQPQEDLSWLNNLGGVEQPQQASPFASAPGDDLGWLNDMGRASEPQPFDAAPDKPMSAPAFAQEEDLSWLNNLGGAAEPAPPAPTSPQDDLSWLNDLGGAAGTSSAPPFLEPETSAQGTPRQAVPPKEEIETPDWLQNAMSVASTPPDGNDVPSDWFAGLDQPVAETPAVETGPASSTPEPSPFSDLFSTPSEAAPASNQDIDALFGVEMPDWLAQSGPAAEQPALEETSLLPAGSDESLAPVDLPSWVQAMRPVEAVISETAPGAEEPEETEGPLAGLRGVIPGMAVGPSQRPKSISLKLQASDEQQASAALLEKILDSETSPRALITPSFVASQQVLRWALAGLFLLVLGVVIGLGMQTMQPSAVLPIAAQKASDAVAGIPTGANVLVVIDYEPSLAGEMEAVSGPLLDQMILLHHPKLSFVSTSTSGAALVDRLIFDTKLNELNVEYQNLGFLPGGSTGVLGFVEDPVGTIPASGIDQFSGYALVILITDHAESGRVWVEQLHAERTNQIDPALASQPLVVIASAQAGPLLQPYLSSNQITGMVSGLSEGARYDYKNGSRPGLARAYWDAFGIGLMMAILLIVVGSLWSLFTGIRARRAEAEQG